MASQIEQIRRLAPYVDPHILVQFLNKHVPKSDGLQKQIKGQMLSAKGEEAQKMEESAKADAVNLLNLLNN